MGVPALPCTAVSVTPAGLCISMPGGSSICLSYPSAGLASAMAGTKMLLAQANVALAPLMPVFRIIECVDAAKDLLWSPDKFFAALANVLGMFPALTVPVLVANALDILILYLQGLYAQLQAFVAQLAAIAAAATKAATLNCPPLVLTVDCASGQLALQMQGVSDGVAPLNALVTSMNLVLGVVRDAGVPNVPTIPVLTDLGPDPAAALAPLATTISVLQTLRSNPFFPA